MATPEGAIQSAICDYLALRKHLFWRANNQPIFDKSKGLFRKMPKYTMKGIPDIIVIHNGNFIGLEVKTDKGRLSKEQKEFERLCKAAGGEYYTVRSVSELRTIGL